MASPEKTDIIVQAPEGTFDYLSKINRRHEEGIGHAYTKRRVHIFSLKAALTGEAPTWYSVQVDVNQSNGEKVFYNFGITDNDLAFAIEAKTTTPEPVDLEPLPVGWEYSEPEEYTPLPSVSLEEILKEISTAERNQRRLKIAA